MKTIVQTLHDPMLFKSWLEGGKGSLTTWHNWEIFLRCLFGLPVTKPKNVELVKQCTGRDASLLPKAGFSKSLALVGRRSGKSRISSVIGATAASCSGAERKLAPGEKGLVVICSPTRAQSHVILDYLKSIYSTIPMFAQQVVALNRDEIVLSNDVSIRVLTGDLAKVRGFSILLAVCEELAFFGLTDETRFHLRSDSELVRALLPALATTNGKLIGISSPYRRQGFCWNTFEKNYGKDTARTLVWNCPSTVMNPTLPQRVVDEALEEDKQSALSEYMAEFRDDISDFISKETIEAVVVKGRKQLLPYISTVYNSFVDISGGRGDSGSLAICHQEGDKVILDYCKEYQSPFSPQQVIRMMCSTLHEYHIPWTTGDAYSANFCADEFKLNHIGYRKCDRNKSQLYLEFLPRLTSEKCQLLDDPVLISQLGALERRTRAGGKDQISHPPGGKDDVVNSCAGAIVECARPKIRMGSWREPSRRQQNPRERLRKWFKENRVLIGVE